MKNLVLVALGLSGGAVVGAGVFAFFMVLGVVTRAMDIGRTEGYEKAYKIAILLGSLISTFIYIFDLGIKAHRGWLIAVGLFMGTFVGMVASALAEVLNVIPFLSINMGIDGWVYLLITAIILGKVVGSIIYWMVPGFY